MEQTLRVLLFPFLLKLKLSQLLSLSSRRFFKSTTALGDAALFVTLLTLALSLILPPPYI